MTATFRRVLAWSVLGLLAVVTLGPLRVRPRFSFDPTTDRMLGFAALGYGFTLAYPRRPTSVALLVLTTAAGLEFGQVVVLGRHARLHDALSKGFGGLVGVGLAVAPWRLAAADMRRTAEPAQIANVRGSSPAKRWST